MRQCSKCLNSYEDYGQRCSLCRSCKQEYDREYYANKLDKNKQRDVKKKRYTDRRHAIFEYLSKNPCVICGENDPIVLEFDHLDPSKKSYSVSEMTNLSIKKIEEEILKCRVLCANCHRRHTAKQRNYYKFLPR